MYKINTKEREIYFILYWKVYSIMQQRNKPLDYK